MAIAPSFTRLILIADKCGCPEGGQPARLGLQRDAGHLPDKWDQSVSDSLRIFRVAHKFFSEELFFDQYPDSKHCDGKDGQDRRGVRF